MHACLEKGTFTLMASDWPGGNATLGDTIQLNIECDSVEEVDSLFKALSKDGKVEQPPHDAFWGARFAALTDKYSTRWMLNCALKP
jgi:PhnB protein